MIANLIRAKLRPARWRKPPLSYQKRRESTFYEDPHPFISEQKRQERFYATDNFHALEQEIMKGHKLEKTQRNIIPVQSRHGQKQKALTKLMDKVSIDHRTGLPKGLGIEDELSGNNQMGKVNYKPFLDYFVELSKSLGMKNDYELLGLFSHSIALRMSPDFLKQAKGMLLGQAIENVLPAAASLSKEDQTVELEKLTKKIAVMLVHQKLRRILGGLQKNSSYQRSDLIDYFLRDARNPQPSEATKRALIRQVYDMSHNEVLGVDPVNHTEGVTMQENLERSYLFAKARVLCDFMGVKEDTVITFRGSGQELQDFRIFWGDKFQQEIDPATSIHQTDDWASNLQASTQRKDLVQMKLLLKDLLSHAGVLDNIESTIVKLEADLNLYPVEAPTPGDVQRQLDLLLHQLPPSYKKDFKIDDDLSQMKYVNQPFSAIQMQWNALDLETPAKIMRVQEQKGYEEMLRMESKLRIDYEDFGEVLDDRLDRLYLQRKAGELKLKAGKTSIDETDYLGPSHTHMYLKEPHDEEMKDRDAITETMPIVLDQILKKGKQARFQGKYVDPVELIKKKKAEWEQLSGESIDHKMPGILLTKEEMEKDREAAKAAAATGATSVAGGKGPGSGSGGNPAIEAGTEVATAQQGAQALAASEEAEANSKKPKKKVKPETKTAMMKRMIEYYKKDANEDQVEEEPDFLEKKEIRDVWRPSQEVSDRKHLLMDLGKSPEEEQEEDNEEGEVPVLLFDPEKTGGSLFEEEMNILRAENEMGNKFLHGYSEVETMRRAVEGSISADPHKGDVPRYDILIGEVLQSSDQAEELPMSIYDRVRDLGKSVVDKFAERLGQNEERSVQLFRHMQEPIYYKHFLAHNFRKAFEGNPYDNQHFLDDKLNPNLGIFYDPLINPNALKNDLGEAEEVLKVYRSRLAAVNPKNKDSIKPSPNSDVSTNPNFVAQKHIAIDRNLYKLRPQEVEEVQKPKLHYFGHGARKTSRAVAVVSVPGTGKIKVNNRELIEYFNEPTSCAHVVRPINAAEKLCQVDVNVYVTGGGVTGQGHAAQTAVAKALARAYPELYEVLHDGYFFYSDNRQVEPKATGRYKARKAYTYVRR